MKTENPNVHYYDTDGKIYNNQLEAYASGKPCYFYYHDREFRNFNWSNPPKENLRDLYRDRAQEIRDKYDYVILCYSGGSDSTNILETFYYNNIHIDEIVMVGAFSQDSYEGDDSNHNGELYYNAFPTIKNMDLPKTKITKIDYTDWFDNPNNFSLIKNYGNEWTLYTGAWRSVHHLFWRDFKSFVGNQNNKKTCYVMGSDKLNFSYIGNLPCFYIFDIAVSDYGNLYENQNFKRINFYTYPEYSAMKIMCKQAHIIREWNKLSQNKIDIIDPEWETTYRNLIYKDLYNPLIYYSPKSKISSISERDMFMLKTDNTEMHKFFREGLKTTRKYSSLKKKVRIHTKPYFI